MCDSYSENSSSSSTHAPGEKPSSCLTWVFLDLIRPSLTDE